MFSSCDLGQNVRTQEHDNVRHNNYPWFFGTCYVFSQTMLSDCTPSALTHATLVELYSLYSNLNEYVTHHHLTNVTTAQIIFFGRIRTLFGFFCIFWEVSTRLDDAPGWTLVGDHYLAKSA